MLVAGYSGFDWKVITLFYGEVGQIAEATSECLDVNGDTQYASIPKQALDALEVLKEVSATPDHGTWVTADVTIVRETGQFNIKYNYDEQPSWTLSLSRRITCSTLSGIPDLPMRFPPGTRSPTTTPTGMRS
ncbi:hypothetical protein [Arthrobacter sp. NA-172]|uniref:hypothetical protein n=1 Tax=Arthrobacter sp. NA-172 TaxID=3367524 RepID=UPI003755329D